MRINKYVASGSGLSRRAADQAIAEGRVLVNGQSPVAGQQIAAGDSVTLDGHAVRPPADTLTLIFNKPAGYVVSRNGQGSDTIYDILPLEAQQLQPVGRLDKDSSGLLVLTNDGALAQQLTHPSYQKRKLYEVTLDQPLAPLHRQMINDHGIQLEDGLSQLLLERQQDNNDHAWLVSMHEGRNRQIRRTFAALGYTVTRLHRTQFGPYYLGDLAAGATKPISDEQNQPE